MAKKGELSMNSLLCDPAVLMGNERLERGVPHLLEQAEVMPDKVIGHMVRAKLRSFSPDDAQAMCRSVAEHGNSEVIGALIKQLINARLKKNS